MEQKQDMSKHVWQGLKEVPLEATRFEAAGKTYHIVKSLSLDRYEAFELLQPELAIGRTIEQMDEEIGRAFDLCNQVATGKPVFAELAVILHDLRIGANLMVNRSPHAILKLCALFMNVEGENLATITNEQIDQKIADWRTEGISISYFFQFALASIPGFVAALKAVSPNTLQEKTMEAQGTDPNTIHIESLA